MCGLLRFKTSLTTNSVECEICIAVNTIDKSTTDAITAKNVFFPRILINVFILAKHVMGTIIAYRRFFYHIRLLLNTINGSRKRLSKYSTPRLP